MNGTVIIYETNTLDIHTIPIVYKCERTDWDDVSTWSIAITPRFCSTPSITVGSNSQRTFTINLPPTNSMIIEHEHNVPSVDYSSCGQYLSSACGKSMKHN
jgi:hypothetical protein